MERTEQSITHEGLSIEQSNKDTSNITHQYDRIDPNDVQALRDEIDDLQIDIKKYEEEKAVREKEAEARAKLVGFITLRSTFVIDNNIQLEDTTTNLQQFKAKYEQLVQQSRQRLGHLNSQVAKGNETIQELRTQLTSITIERDKLAAQKNASVTSSSDTDTLKSQLESVSREKEAITRTLAEEKDRLAKTIAEKDALLVCCSVILHRSTVDIPIIHVQATLREEKEKLAAANAALSSSGESTTSGEGGENVKRLEAEKKDLISARDSAIARAQVSNFCNVPVIFTLSN